MRSFVTDNTGNVSVLGRNLQNNEQVNVIQYGCSAHILNLLAKDVTLANVQKHVLKIVKHFRNTRLAAAWYKAEGGSMLVVPTEVRWNTISNCIRSYLQNRGKIVTVCDQHRAEIPAAISELVNDQILARNAEDYRDRMTPIAIALDRAQRDSSTIAVAVEIWIKLQADVQNQPRQFRDKLDRRMKMALDRNHFLANMLDHRFRGERLSESQRAAAYELVGEINENFPAILMAYIAGDPPFPRHMFGTQFRDVAPLTWWRSLAVGEDLLNFNQLKDTWIAMCEQYMTATASTAGVERLFSTFGLVQSKLRNRLGNEKAAKLTFMFKHLNEQSDKKKSSLKWIWSEEDDTSDDNGDQGEVELSPNPESSSDNDDQDLAVIMGDP